jgi:hypothetical protein
LDGKWGLSLMAWLVGYQFISQSATTRYKNCFF